MKTIDPGHIYSLDTLDGKAPNILRFVKREGVKYPGNKGKYPGTTTQEVLRALIDRGIYVNNQIQSFETERAIEHMKLALYQLELRAARLHNREIDFSIEEAVLAINKCMKCGHVGCKGECK